MERMPIRVWALVTAIASAGLVACTGDTIVLPGGDDETDPSGGGAVDGGSGPGTGGSTSTSTPQGGAKDMFLTQVFPAINSACGSCHSGAEGNGAPVFWGSSAESSYNAITGYTPSLIAIPANSNLVLHGEHTGPALDAGQLATVSEWLQAEADERGLTGGETNPPPSGPTLQEALQGFADCMSYDDWVNTGMDTIASSQTQYGDCNGCHASGEGGFIANKINDEDMFNKSRTFPYVKKFVSGTVDENGSFAGLVEARRIINKGNEAANCDPDVDNCHPVFSLPPAKVQAVEDFVSLTLTKYENGGCTP